MKSLIFSYNCDWVLFEWIAWQHVIEHCFLCWTTKFQYRRSLKGKEFWDMCLVSNKIFSTWRFWSSILMRIPSITFSSGFSNSIHLQQERQWHSVTHGTGTSIKMKSSLRIKATKSPFHTVNLRAALHAAISTDEQTYLKKRDSNFWNKRYNGNKFTGIILSVLSPIHSLLIPFTFVFGITGYKCVCCRLERVPHFFEDYLRLIEIHST